MLGIKQDPEGKRSAETWIGPAPWIQGPLPGPIAAGYIARDQQATTTAYTRDYPLVVKSASGSVVEDVDGNRFLDFAAGIAVCSTGHCHPKVVGAIEAQARNLMHICGADFYYPPMIELVEKLIAITPGDHPKRVFLTNSGTEAIEATIKFARQFTGRKWLIGFYGAFHGRTMGSLSITCSKVRQRESFGPFMPMVAHVPYGNADAIENHLFKHMMAPSEVAAIFVEAVQGEGGYVIPDASFLPKLRAICDKHGILLVCDEIQSGAGRTGKWFAFQHFDAVPDVIVMAKGIASGMPIGAVVAGSEIMGVPPGSHGGTFGGNPVCCAAAVATLNLIESQYMAAAARLGPKLVAGLAEIAERRKTIGNPRGLGLMCAFDVINRRTGKSDSKLRNKVLQSAFERGLILLGCGESSIRVVPPLCINETQLDVGLRLIEEAVAAAN